MVGTVLCCALMPLSLRTPRAVRAQALAALLAVMGLFQVPKYLEHAPQVPGARVHSMYY
jgi:hypothetical protein